jgi:ERCC4-type nuclease
MLIRVDTREDALHGMFKLNSAHQLRSEPLPVGDVILSSANSENDYVVFERKTLLDLAASIRDGRYKEQSHRLQAIPNVHCHNVVYIIEGDLARYNERFSKISKKALYSAMCSLNYYKGFSVVRTMSIMETHELIQHYADKLAASPAPYGKYYSVPASAADEAATTATTTAATTAATTATTIASTIASTPTTTTAATTAAAEEPSYCSVLKVKQVKCENITPQNIGEIMLCNIPGVSNKTAAVIVKKYPTLRALIEAFKTCGSSDCLNDIRLETQRKLSKQCIQNIYNFLMT